MLEEFLPLVGLNDWTNLDTSFLTFKGLPVMFIPIFHVRNHA
ncbi:hypothetical protein [uncultured Methanobrevibacter sp.]|nr:hypothetical protein [uncultured Methanobrevibacter sp.]